MSNKLLSVWLIDLPGIDNLTISYASRSPSTATGEDTDSSTTSSRARNIPADVKLFDLFWFQITNLIAARPEFSLLYIIDLLGSLVNLSLKCYPNHLEYVDNVLGYAKQKIVDATANMSKSVLDLLDEETLVSLLNLLLCPVHAYKHHFLENLLEFPSSSAKSSSEGSKCLGG